MSGFKDAIEDYKYLLDKDYPQKALLKLVGDKYRLSKQERNCLFRGVGKTSESLDRKKKIISHEVVQDSPLGIDWYNVLITVDSYLKGYPLFISDDGLLRDSSGVHASFHPKESTHRAVKEIIGSIEVCSPRGITIYLDAPISHSGEMAQGLRTLCSEILSFPHIIEVVPTADYYLKTFLGVIASSDSVICDHAHAVFDLAHFVLFTRYHFTPPPVRDLHCHKKGEKN
jgi:hypothetical protein